MTTEGGMNCTRVTMRVDASTRMGGGHVMRCLALADMLAARTARVTFVAAAMLPGLADRIRAGGYRFERITPAADDADDADWDSRVLPARAQRDDARATLAAAGAADLTIVDHYRLDAEWERAVRPGRLLVIDDLANRPHDCDILLDQTFGVSAHRYAGLTNADCTLLTGSAYALLRPEFAAARPAALRRRRDARTLERILISLGSTDIGRITERTVSALLEAGMDCALDVVLPASAPSLPPLRARAQADPRISLHIDSDAMADLMSGADLAIGAAGTTSWERCCLGLPTVTLILADNQREVARQLAAAEAAIAVATPQEAAARAVALAHDPAPLGRMVAACAAIVDGGGTPRVADRLAKAARPEPGALRLRRAGPEDSERLWLWRNDPFTRSMATSPIPIAWPDHDRWFTTILANPDTQLLLVERGGVPVAMVRFDRTGSEAALVSINVAPTARGMRIGREALGMACDRYRATHPGAALNADIHVTNAASLRIFTKAGFEMVGMRSDFHQLSLTRSTPA